MKKSNAITLLISVTFAAISSGCFLYSASYKGLDPRCKEWVKQYYKEYDTSRKHALSIPDAETRYNYYMCINRITATFAIGDYVFNDIPEPTITLLKKTLPENNDEFQAWKSISIISELNTSGAYDVSKDHEMIQILLNRVSRMEDGPFKTSGQKMINRILNKK